MRVERWRLDGACTANWGLGPCLATWGTFAGRCLPAGTPSGKAKGCWTLRASRADRGLCIGRPSGCIWSCGYCAIWSLCTLRHSKEWSPYWSLWDLSRPPGMVLDPAPFWYLGWLNLGRPHGTDPYGCWRVVHLRYRAVNNHTWVMLQTLSFWRWRLRKSKSVVFQVVKGILIDIRRVRLHGIIRVLSFF